MDLELNVLQSIEDVTERINAAVKPGMSSAEANQARRAAMNTVEKESLDKTGLRSDVVTLYQGGLYHLYRFKKYTDIRLVFAPEKDIAFFGGDPDNFEYPRYDLDICFFRVYEDGKPAKIEHYLKWSPEGRGRRRAGLRLGPSRPDRPARYDGPHRVPPRQGLPAGAAQAVPLGGHAVRLQRRRAGRTPAGPRTICSASRTAARPAWACSPACRTPPS